MARLASPHSAASDWKTIFAGTVEIAGLLVVSAVYLNFEAALDRHPVERTHVRVVGSNLGDTLQFKRYRFRLEVAMKSWR